MNSSNVEFYLGTHAHSDHTGLAAKIIKHFKPKRIYTPEYNDNWISDSNRLWDNRYVYDKMIAAAKAAENEYGAALIQHLVPGAPVVPTPERPHTASPSFDFGAMHIELVNYEEDYKYHAAIGDANLSAWGAKVTAFGRSAFLSSDIENTDGDEDKIAPLIGQVDFLKLGHHGTYTSNSRGYLEILRPKYAFQTGKYSYMFDQAIDTLNRLGTRWYPAAEVAAAGWPAYVVTFTPKGMQTPNLGNELKIRSGGYGASGVAAYRDGKKERQNGWVAYAGSWYFFQNSANAVRSKWINAGGNWFYLDGKGVMDTGWLNDQGTWYYLQASGAMATGWIIDRGAWYYLHPSGAMATGTTWIGGRGSLFSTTGAWLGYTR
ncbi:Autolysin [Actinomyces bovis]|uniref:Autolysin n=1 Tax=Actinomyces bovis TaxID=1658 RepID=A0ABY1VQZ2_9ACTO|nr:Autolysin [Actinomyces bovis]VEG53208.1 Autolysin [Actinomyces israelii]